MYLVAAVTLGSTALFISARYMSSSISPNFSFILCDDDDDDDDDDNNNSGPAMLAKPSSSFNGSV